MDVPQAHASSALRETVAERPLTGAIRTPDGSEYRGGSSSLRGHEMTDSHGNPSMDVPQAHDSCALREVVAGRPHQPYDPLMAPRIGAVEFRARPHDDRIARKSFTGCPAGA